MKDILCIYNRLCACVSAWMHLHCLSSRTPNTGMRRNGCKMMAELKEAGWKWLKRKQIIYDGFGILLLSYMNISQSTHNQSMEIRDNNLVIRSYISNNDNNEHKWMLLTICAYLWRMMNTTKCEAPWNFRITLASFIRIPHILMAFPRFPAKIWIQRECVLCVRAPKIHWSLNSWTALLLPVNTTCYS